jgi:hypothetical protein
MSKWLIRFPLKFAGWGLGIVGAATLALAAMIATPLSRPPELTSVSKAARAVDRSTMPPLARLPRELGAFWPIYFMLFYCLAGLWFGRAFISIGLGITALILIGYFFVGGAAFLLWMAAVNGGGLILGGLWMRRM